jgi:hypothetical protein
MSFGLVHRPGTGIRFTERGVSTVEFVVILPFIVLFFFGLFEIGRALNTYNLMTQVTREGARYASKLHGLSAGEHNSTACGASCGGHQKVFNRVKKLVRDQRLEASLGNADALTIISDYDTANDGEIHIAISGNYEGLLFFRSLSLASSATAPYLFR